MAVWFAKDRSTLARHTTTRRRGPLTFNKDVAPLVFTHCAPCHRPGQAAPFSLLTYADVGRRAKQIAEVTRTRQMPPWLPEAGHGQFVGERRLSTEQIDLLQRWTAEGAPEGNPADLPQPPAWSGGWQLGAPDLVVKLPKAYRLGAEGRDVYRNLVIPIPTHEARYVQAVEFDPGNPRVVHHAFIRFDRTRQSRRLDEQDPEPGFDGLHLPGNIEMPEGQFLSWQPGKQAARGPAGLSWTLEPDTDLVLQMHLQPSGKTEELQPAVAFFFTDQPPTNRAFKMCLRSLDIDIPPGKADYHLEEVYELPVHARLLAVLPHAHYLAREMRATAALPDGTSRSLLWIRQWDFNWQGDYRYREPVFLPKGTKVAMRYTYDNSTNNIHNPNQPPRRVQYGVQSSDEMGELWLQLLPNSTNDLSILKEENEPRAIRETIAYNQYLLRLNPGDARAHHELGKALLVRGQTAEGSSHLLKAADLDGTFDEPHYFLGVMFRIDQRLPEAIAAFEEALRRNPQNSKAHGNLGFIFLDQGKLESAEQHFQSALGIDPNDALAKTGLEDIQQARSKRRASPQ